MAAITSVTVAYQSPDVSERLVVYAIRKVTSGDTFDTTTLFSSVTYAALVPVTRAGLTPSTSISGTVVTMTATGLANDGVYLVIFGEGPQ